MTAKSREAFRTISEVSDWLDTPAHVLRFWESKFSQIRPVKRAGGRRYYRPEDMALLGGIKILLHEQGMTIKGVQKMLREQGVRHVAALGPQPAAGDGDWIEMEAGEDAEARPLAARTADPPAAPPAPARRPRAGLLAALLSADPARLARNRARIAPLLARLAAARARMETA